MYKEDLALNDLQWLICHKTQTKPKQTIYMYKKDLALNNLQRLICDITKQNQTIYMYKEDLALNDLQWLICHKTKPNQSKPNFQPTNQLTKPSRQQTFSDRGP